MSAFESELQAVADRVIAQAKPGEQVEAFVTRGGETDVRIYRALASTSCRHRAKESASG